MTKVSIQELLLTFSVDSKNIKIKKVDNYTRSKQVVRVLYTEKYNTRSDALKREVQIKGWTRVKKLNLIKFGKPVIKSKS